MFFAYKQLLGRTETRTRARRYLGRIRSVSDISRDDRARIATCSLRTPKGDNKVVLLVLIDLSAAFDTVNHERLLSTLHAIGITGKALALFTSYLQNRSQTITINGKQSRSQKLVCVVPQGTVIGPILFNIIHCCPWPPPSPRKDQLLNVR